MSDPIDARVFRELVRELALEEPRPVDWDRAEEALFARLETARLETAEEDAQYVSTQEPTQDPSSNDEDELGLFGEGDRISEVALGLPEEPESTGVAEHRRGSEFKRDRISLTGGHDSSGDRVSSPYVAARHASVSDGSSDSPGAIHHVPPIGSLHDILSEQVLSKQSKRALSKKLGKESVNPGAPIRRWSQVLAFVAVAASIAFVLGGLVTGGIGKNAGKNAQLASGSNSAEITAERWVDPADVPMAPGGSGAHDLAALRSGDMVEATSGAVSFAEADKLSWTISPGSRVLVRTGVDSPRHVLILESGSIRADVLPVAAGGIVDPFVVEAGDTRVAVEGTIFSVTRSSKAIVVDVEHGFVVVGPRNELGVGSGRLLHESERGSFSLDGGLTFKALSPERTALLSPADKARASSADTPSADMASEDATHTQGPTASNGLRENSARGKEPSAAERLDLAAPSPKPSNLVPNDPVMTEASIKASLDRCFAQVEAQKHEGSKDDGVSVSMRSTLRLRVADDGAIKGASFNPPLRPDLQSCAVSLLSAHVDRGARTLEIPVEIRR